MMKRLLAVSLSLMCIGTIPIGEMQKVVLVDSELLSIFNLLCGAIQAVVYERNTVTLDSRLDAGQSLKGQTIVISNQQNCIFYEIKDVSENQGKTVLHFGDVPMIVGTGAVSTLDAAQNAVEMNTIFFNWQVDGSQHAGR